MTNLNLLIKKPFQWVKQRLTLRLRIALASTSLVLLTSLGLVLFINLMASKRALVTFTSSDNFFILATPESLYENIDDNQAGIQHTTSPGYTPSSAAIIQSDLLGRVQRLSLIGFGLVAILGGLAAYWIIGIALKPVSLVSQTARRISAEKLNERLSLEGPRDEVKELADAFDQMLNRLETAFEQQGEFVANAAHELRTPLTVLRTNLDVIQSTPSVSIEDYRMILITLERSIYRLECLVTDLLLLAKSEKEIAIEKIIVGVLLEETIGDLSPMAQEKDIDLLLNGELEILIHGDPTLLGRAFANLLENGIRYNNPGGKVEITVSSENGHVVVSFVDNGPGISLDEQSHIFERFYRADKSRSRYSGGAGLGLSIAAHIVHLHQGEITVESYSGKGSKFSVRLPS